MKPEADIVRRRSCYARISDGAEPNSRPYTLFVPTELRCHLGAAQKVVTA
jgi:hypothetical protein